MGGGTQKEEGKKRGNGITEGGGSSGSGGREREMTTPPLRPPGTTIPVALPKARPESAVSLSIAGAAKTGCETQSSTNGDVFCHQRGSFARLYLSAMERELAVLVLLQ